MTEAVTIRDLNHHYPDGTVSLEDVTLTFLSGRTGQGKQRSFSI